jgi:hypothetical protein
MNLTPMQRLVEIYNAARLANLGAAQHEALLAHAAELEKALTPKPKKALTPKPKKAKKDVA